MGGAGGAGEPTAGERPRRSDRPTGGQRLRQRLAVAALVLGILAGLGLAGEIFANLLRIGGARIPLLLLGGVALVGAVALAGARPWPPRRRSRAGGAMDAPAEATASRRALRWQRRLGGQPAAAAPEDRGGRRRRRRRGRGGPTSNDG